MSRAASDLDFAYQEVAKIQADLDTKTGDLENKVEKLDIIRRRMSKADLVLEDCHLILQGLAQTRKNIEEQQNEIQDG